jgi:hypothetical protein
MRCAPGHAEELIEISFERSGAVATMERLITNDAALR